jgi:hypothetical protein
MMMDYAAFQNYWRWIMAKKEVERKEKEKENG